MSRAANSTVVRSPPGGPIACTPMGRPAALAVMGIVVAGARSDLGQKDQALAILSTPQLDRTRTGQTAARLFYAYAEALLALDRQVEALQWFINAAAADVEGVTDAEERITELA